MKTRKEIIVEIKKGKLKVEDFFSKEEILSAYKELKLNQTVYEHSRRVQNNYQEAVKKRKELEKKIRVKDELIAIWTDPNILKFKGQLIKKE